MTRRWGRSRSRERSLLRARCVRASATRERRPHRHRRWGLPEERQTPECQPEQRARRRPRPRKRQSPGAAICVICGSSPSAAARGAVGACSHHTDHRSARDYLSDPRPLKEAPGDIHNSDALPSRVWIRRIAIGLVVGALAAALLLPPLGALPTASGIEPTTGSGSYLNGNVALRGVNVYTLEQQRSLPNSQTKLDSQQSFDFLASRGFTLVRLAVPWQRIIPIQGGESPASSIMGTPSNAYLRLLKDEVAEAAHSGMRTVIDLHDGCVYPWAGRSIQPGRDLLRRRHRPISDHSCLGCDLQSVQGR